MCLILKSQTAEEFDSWEIRKILPSETTYETLVWTVSHKQPKQLNLCLPQGTAKWQDFVKIDRNMRVPNIVEILLNILLAISF